MAEINHEFMMACLSYNYWSSVWFTRTNKKKKRSRIYRSTISNQSRSRSLATAADHIFSLNTVIGCSRYLNATLISAKLSRKKIKKRMKKDSGQQNGVSRWKLEMFEIVSKYKYIYKEIPWVSLAWC